MKQSKKKKRSRASSKGNAENHDKIADEKEQGILKNLLEGFASVSVEEAASAYREADRDLSKAAETPGTSAVLEEQSMTCSSSSQNYDAGSSSSSNASEVFGDANNFLQDGFKQKSKHKLKKIVASAGTVSTVLGKDYVRSIPKKAPSKSKGFREENWSKEEAEQFLCSMLGDDCELSLAVVSDVLCQCDYNLDKALDVLLELSASSKEQVSGYYESTSRGDAQYLLESNYTLIDGIYDSTSRSSDIELQDNIWFTGNLSRNVSKTIKSGESHHPTETGNLESELPQKVLESLFNMPTPKTAEHEPNTMNWRNVVKKMTSLGHRFEPGDSEQGCPINAKGDEYQVYREAAKQHWNSMKSYYQKAATAFTNGEKEYAAYLSQQGRLQNKMAREADEKASQDIFSARNESIENVITIDLHGQHIKQAMKLLKLHLLFGAYVRSVRSFRVITGCGSHGVGKSKLKNSVINLLQKEGITWSEENRGTLFIRLDGQRDFSFLDSGSDSD
ncbi:SMR domain-containing protein At5g58720 isoform X2 [Sesamum indicum]|uniref:SMR domain-containing protein At5g58720 isoform X2 n=1 Tax=Sesamum indicum TaxID=4182 RepID=A0A6I9TB44_SESIN|nr:SMR domain-containing protein At5g58720 isoform X2 [Sesamum indicum]